MLFLYSVDRLIQVIHWKHLHTHHVVCPDIFSCGSVKQTEMDNLKKSSHNSVVRLANHTGRGLLTHRKAGHGRSETLSQLSFDNVLKFSIKLKECLCSYLTLAAATSKTNWIRGFLCLKNRKKWHSRIVEFIAQGSSQGFWNHNIIYITTHSGSLINIGRYTLVSSL